LLRAPSDRDTQFLNTSSPANCAFHFVRIL
jgi:hypothetical protein